MEGSSGLGGGGGGIGIISISMLASTWVNPMLSLVDAYICVSLADLTVSMHMTAQVVKPKVIRIACYLQYIFEL